MDIKIGYKINIAMKEEGVTQEDLADTLKTSQSLVSNWVTGKIIPGKKNLEKIAIVLKKPLTYFLERCEGLSDIPDYSKLALQFALEDYDKIKAEWELIYNRKNDGVTKNSLLMLREILLKVYREEVIVLDIKTGVNSCGFLIIERSNFKAYWTGDGFGKGYSGEGPKGYEAAAKYISMNGLDVYEWDGGKIVNDDDKGKFNKKLVEITETAYRLHETRFKMPMMSFPNY